MGNRLRTFTKRRRGGTKCTAAHCGAKGNRSMDINSFMSGNQSFNQSLYAPLTRDPLVCRPAVNFMRKVYMKRRPILRGILSAGVRFSFPCSCSVSHCGRRQGCLHNRACLLERLLGRVQPIVILVPLIARRSRKHTSLARTMLPVTFTGSRGIRAACPWLVQGLSFSTRMWTWSAPLSAPKMAAIPSRVSSRATIK